MPFTHLNMFWHSFKFQSGRFCPIHVGIGLSNLLYWGKNFPPELCRLRVFSTGIRIMVSHEARRTWWPVERTSWKKLSVQGSIAAHTVRIIYSNKVHTVYGLWLSHCNLPVWLMTSQPLCLATPLPGYPHCLVAPAAWLPSCLATQLPGYPSAWLPLCLVTPLPGYPSAWLSLCLVIPLPCYPSALLPLCLATPLPGYSVPGDSSASATLLPS
jgi:hypothetical protein